MQAMYSKTKEMQRSAKLDKPNAMQCHPKQITAKQSNAKLKETHIFGVDFFIAPSSPCLGWFEARFCSAGEPTYYCYTVVTYISILPLYDHIIVLSCS